MRCCIIIYRAGASQIAHNMIKSDYTKFTTYNRSIELTATYFITPADKEWIKRKLLTK